MDACTAGDFNLDGSDDLLWYAPATGDVARWLMHGRHVAPTVEYVGSAGIGWKVVP